MSTLSPRQSLAALRPWTARSAEHLAAAATLLLERLGLAPAPETTAAPRLTARTIRYYVAEGLLSPPEGHTRRAVYRYRHLLELLWIKAAQAHGQALDDIRRELHEPGGAGVGDVADLEAALVHRLPDPAPLPLPGNPAELDRAVALRLRRPLGESGAVSGAGAAAAAAYRLALSAEPALRDPEGRAPRERDAAGGDPLMMCLPAALPDRPGPRALDKPTGRPRPEASLQVQVHLGEGIRLLIPADHPLAEAIPDRGLTVTDLYRLLQMPDPPRRNDHE